MTMNRVLVAATAAVALVAAGCSPVALGTGVGAGLGAIVTLALGGNPQQIAIGTLIGGAGGFIVSSLVQAQNQPPGVCQAVNQYGQPIYVTQNGQYVTYNTGYPLLVNC
jgi:hypothetical protein